MTLPISSVSQWKTGSRDKRHAPCPSQLPSHVYPLCYCLVVQAWLIEDITERPDSVDVRLRRREARPHRIHGHVARTQGAPRLDAPVPFVFVEPLHADPGIDAKNFAIAASLFEIAMELLNIGFDLVIR